MTPTNPNPPSPDALLADCARGERAALQKLYQLEAPRMLGVALRLLKRRSLAEEAVQDAFVLVWRHAGSFDPVKGDALPWLYTLLRNRCLSILRTESRLVTSAEPLGEEQASDEDDPETVMSKLSDQKALRHCLEKLEPARREAVILAFVQGLTHGELAGRLGMPLGTLKSWIRRSLISLKECLG